MKNRYLFSVLLLTWSYTATMAVEYYAPGDTLWVWAVNGLNLREAPDSKAWVIGKISNGEKVVTLDWQNKEQPFSLEVIKRSVRELGQEKQDLPNLVLEGYWVKVTYNGLTGYVFDAYLSRLPTIMSRQYEKNTKDDFYASCLKKHNKIIKQTGKNEYDLNDQKSVQYIFENGDIVRITGGSGNWVREMLFTENLSLTEGYLIYAHTMRMERDVLLEKGDNYLKFEIGDGTLTIKKAGSFLIMYEEHAC